MKILSEYIVDNRKIITIKQYFTYLEEYHKYKNPFIKLKFRFK